MEIWIEGVRGMRKDVYIKPERRVSIITDPIVRLKDVAEVSGPKTIQTEIEELCIFQVKNLMEKKSYVVSVIDLIDVITHRFPDVRVSNLGEMDTIIHYLPEPIEEKKWFEWLKVIVICIIIFAGVSIAIMAYHNDTGLARVFTVLNEVFTGEYEKNPLYITIPYAIGIPVGTLVFFNHIGTKKMSEDPTPIEVEIVGYEAQVEDTIVATITRKNQESKKKKGGST